MRYAITYSRKLRVKAYDMIEISLHREFDETTPIEEAYKQVRDQVKRWINEERERVMKDEIPR